MRNPFESPKVNQRISHTLISRMPVMMKNSQNLYAESFFRILGKELGGDGSFESSGRVLANWARKNFQESESLVFRDGSGLSRLNRLDARFLRSVVDWVLLQSWAESLFECMAFSGVDGTLEKRMATDLLKGKVCAKTGTLNDVSSLVGWLKPTGVNQPITFAFVFNGRKGQVAKARQWQDRCLDLLAKRRSGNESQ